jgi:hypothetical protein
MTKLSENTKLRFDPHQGKVGFDQEQLRSDEPPHLEETEAQMRRALGLFGDMSRRQDQDRSDSPQRSADRLMSGGHRRRFVQDGDVPVTVVRRDQGLDNAAQRASLNAPGSSRLQRTEAALAAETAARDRAERGLAEAQAMAHDLQTKIGHAELAKHEATEALRREREEIAAVRTAASQNNEQLRAAAEQMERLEQAAAAAEEALADERRARKAAERIAREAEAAREMLEHRVHDLMAEQDRVAQAEQVERAAERVAVRSAPLAPSRMALVSAPPRRPKVAVAPVPETEPEPVKWWLMAKPAAKRR